MYCVDIKTVFADALVQLLAEKPIQNISVRQIAVKCNLSSRSFYNYFSDKFDLMNYIYYNMNEPCWFMNGRPGSLIPSYSNWAHKIADYSDVLRNMYKYAGQNNIREFVLKKTRSDLRRLFIWNNSEELLKDQRTSEIIDLMAYGLCSLMEHMLSTNGVHGPNADTLISCIPEPQRSILTNDPVNVSNSRTIEIYNASKTIWPPKLYI